MKIKIMLLSIIGILAIISLTGCMNTENKIESTEEHSSISNKIVIDYNNSSLFETALNNGDSVKGKIVKFDIIKYEPNSAMGINCWSGEHLNFISDKELDVKTGDTVIGRVIEEPTSYFGSWIIKYEIIEIQHKEETIENVELKESSDELHTEEDNDISIDEEKNEEEVKYNYYTTNENDEAKNGNKGKYSYIKRAGSYNVYWIIDFDDGYVYDFTEGNGDESCEKIKIKSGNLNDGLELAYKKSDNAWVKYIHFKYTNQPHQLIIVDNDYFEYDYSTTDLKNALDIMKTKEIWEP